MQLLRLRRCCCRALLLRLLLLLLLPGAADAPQQRRQLGRVVGAREPLKVGRQRRDPLVRQLLSAAVQCAACGWQRPPRRCRRRRTPRSAAAARRAHLLAPAAAAAVAACRCWRRRAGEARHGAVEADLGHLKVLEAVLEDAAEAGAARRGEDLNAHVGLVHRCCWPAGAGAGRLVLVLVIVGAGRRRRRRPRRQRASSARRRRRRRWRGGSDGWQSAERARCAVAAGARQAAGATGGGRQAGWCGATGAGNQNGEADSQLCGSRSV